MRCHERGTPGDTMADSDQLRTLRATRPLPLYPDPEIPIPPSCVAACLKIDFRTSTATQSIPPRPALDRHRRQGDDDTDTDAGASVRVRRVVVAHLRLGRVRHSLGCALHRHALRRVAHLGLGDGLAGDVSGRERGSDGGR
jgi:hypothetical protein